MQRGLAHPVARVSAASVEPVNKAEEITDNTGAEASGSGSGAAVRERRESEDVTVPLVEDGEASKEKPDEKTKRGTARR